MYCIFSQRLRNRNTMIEEGLRKCLATHVSGTVTKEPGQHNPMLCIWNRATKGLKTDPRADWPVYTVTLVEN